MKHSKLIKHTQQTHRARQKHAQGKESRQFETIPILKMHENDIDAD